VSDPLSVAGAVIAGAAIGDAPAPFGQVALIAIHRDVSTLADLRILPVAPCHDGGGTAIELFGAQPIGAMRGILAGGCRGGEEDGESGEQKRETHPARMTFNS